MDAKTYQIFLPVAGALLQSGADGIAGLVGDSAAAAWLKGVGEQLNGTPAAGFVRDLQAQAGPKVQQLVQQGAEGLRGLLKNLRPDPAHDGKEPHDNGNE